MGHQQTRAHPQLALALALVAVAGTLMQGAHASFLNIAHMVDSAEALDWAVDTQGANGVEMDIRFDTSGQPTVFQHSTSIWQPCDCTCLLSPPSSSVCSVLSSCMAQVAVADQLRLVASKGGAVRLVYFDGKVDSTQASLADAGQGAYAAMRDNLFGQGWGGIALVGAPTTQYVAYLQAVLAAARADGNGRLLPNIMFTIDGQNDYGTVRPVLAALKADGAQVVYSDGISACAPEPSAVRAGVEAAVGELGSLWAEVLVWTLDKQSSMANYMAAGVTGLLTNQPATLNQLLAGQPSVTAAAALARPATASNDTLAPLLQNTTAASAADAARNDTAGPTAADAQQASASPPPAGDDAPPPPTPADGSPAAAPAPPLPMAPTNGTNATASGNDTAPSDANAAAAGAAPRRLLARRAAAA